jgi:hypothetical protein
MTGRPMNVIARLPPSTNPNPTTTKPTTPSGALIAM